MPKLTDSKFSPLSVVRDHYATYYSYRSHRVGGSDFVLTLFVPLIFLDVASSLRLSLASASALLLGIALTGILITTILVAIVFVPSALSAASKQLDHRPALSQRCILLEELLANASYAALATIVALILLVTVPSTHGTAKSILSTFVLTASLHATIVLMMVVKRYYLVTKASIVEARTTGANSSSSHS